MSISDVTVVIRWILALALGVAAAWLAYGRVGALARNRAILLGALRALAVTLVAAILFGAPSAPPRPAAPPPDGCAGFFWPDRSHWGKTLLTP